MTRLYATLRNFLVIILVFEIFDSAVLIGSQNFMDKLLLGVGIGFILTFSPSILKFFKQQVNVASQLLVNLVIVFATLFVLNSPLNYIRIQQQNVITGISVLDPIVIGDTTMGILILTISIALLVAIFELIHRNAR